MNLKIIENNETINILYHVDDEMIENVRKGLTPSQSIELTEEDIDFTPTQEDLVKLQILQLKQQLADTDYKAIKFAEGLISAEDYEPIKQQRQAWRNEINELEKEV